MRCADTRELQDVRRVDGARSQNDLSPCARRHALALAGAPRERHARHAIAFEVE
jgi:hypothetical protein